MTVDEDPSRAVAVVSGFYNRLASAVRMVVSVRAAVGAVPYRIIAVDGGSTDGTREWLSCQKDVFLLGERGPLRGAVRAYNRAFAHAVDEGYGYVCILNDDDEMVTSDPPAIEKAVRMLEAQKFVGAVAFETDLRGHWSFEEWHGRPYVNKGVVRRDAGMAAARAQGDPSGRTWWTPEHKHYASDTELGLWIWRLGWLVRRGAGCRVRDHAPTTNDALRAKNVAEYDTIDKFRARWSDASSAVYNRVDAERFGGLLLDGEMSR